MNPITALRNLVTRKDPVSNRRGGGIIGRTPAGIHVDEHNALTYSAVWACVRIISESIGYLPWHHRQKRPAGGSDVLQSALDTVLHTRPNAETSAMDWRTTMLAWALQWGNGYAEIERDRRGERIVALWQIAPDRVTPTRDRDTGELFYRVWNNGGEPTDLAARDVFHLKGLGFDGIVGYPVISLAAKSIGLGLGTQEYGSRFFGNGSSPSGVLKHPKKLGDQAKQALRESWATMHQGPANSSRTAILEEGMEWQQLGIPPENAQFLETRKFQVSEIARWFRVPPHKLADLERATFSNIAQQSVEFVTDTLLPWTTRLEQEADAKLLGLQQRARSFTRIDVKGLLAGDTDTRSKFYESLWKMGAISPDEIRELEDMNPIPGGAGGNYFIQMNIQTLERAIAEPEPEPEPVAPMPEMDTDNGGDDPKQETVPEPSAALARLAADAGARIAARETHRYRILQNRHDDDRSRFISSALRFISDGHTEYVGDQVRPLIFAGLELLGATVEGDLENRARAKAARFARDYTEATLGAWTSGYDRNAEPENTTPADFAGRVLRAIAALNFQEENQ